MELRAVPFFKALLLATRTLRPRRSCLWKSASDISHKDLPALPREKNRKRYPKQPVFTVNGWMFGDLQPFPYIKICFIIIQLIANHIFQQMVIRFQVAVCRIHHRFVEDFCLVQEFQWLRQLCQHLSKDFLRFVIFGTVNGC